MQLLPDAAYTDEHDTVQAVTTAVTHVAVALDELKDQLEIANRRVSQVAAAQATEAEFGRLFVRAAEFADSAIAEAQDEARQLVADARREADRIVADARGQAEAIIEEAERSASLPSAFAVRVQAALDGFSHVNDEFIKELEFLRGSLQPALTSPTTARAAVLPAPEPVAMTASPAAPESLWRPEVSEVSEVPKVPEVPEVPEVSEVSEVPSSMPAGTGTSLDSLLAGAWRPAPGASPPSSTQVPAVPAVPPTPVPWAREINDPR